MSNKKKILALSLVLALGATLMVGGTLAWFSDTDEVTNTFTVGSVEIEQNETNKDGSEFTQDQQLIPVVENGKTDATEFANFVFKKVTVENTGKNAAFVQTFIAVPAALDNGLLHLDVELVSGGWAAVNGGQPVDTKTIEWDGDGDEQTTDDVVHLDMNIYQYRYAVALAKDETSPVLLNGVYIDKAADMDVIRDADGDATEACFLWDIDGDKDLDKVEGYDLVKIEKLPVLVATQAVQAQGFNDAATALNSAFLHHPWSVAPTTP